MVVILFSGAEPFEQTVNTPSTEDSMLNLVKIGQMISEMTFKDYTILYMYIAYGQGQIPAPPPTPPMTIFDLLLKCFTTLIILCKF